MILPRRAAPPDQPKTSVPPHVQGVVPIGRPTPLDAPSRLTTPERLTEHGAVPLADPREFTHHPVQKPPFGIAARVSRNAVNELRKQGIKAGLIRPITVWPFPVKPIREAADKVKAFVSVELSMGQMIEDVRLAEECKKPVVLCNRAGGMIPSPEQVIETVKDLEGGKE